MKGNILKEQEKIAKSWQNRQERINFDVNFDQIVQKWDKLASHKV